MNGPNYPNSRSAAPKRAVVPLDLDDTTTVLRILQLQLSAYQTEARLAGFREPPFLPDGIPSIRQSGEAFFGVFSPSNNATDSPATSGNRKFGAELIDAELIGAASAAVRSHATQICRLMVHSEHMRQGVAGTLLEHLIAAYPQSPLFTVTVNTRNVPAIALYEKFGFVPVNCKMLGPDLLFTEMQLPAR